MSAIVIIAVLVAIVAAIAAALGAAPLVLAVIPVALVAVGVVLLLGGTRRKPQEVAREMPRQDFLGPGGQDDPDRSR